MYKELITPLHVEQYHHLKQIVEAPLPQCFLEHIDLFKRFAYRDSTYDYSDCASTVRSATVEHEKTNAMVEEALKTASDERLIATLNCLRRNYKNSAYFPEMAYLRHPSLKIYKKPYAGEHGYINIVGIDRLYASLDCIDAAALWIKTLLLETSQCTDRPLVYLSYSVDRHILYKNDSVSATILNKNIHIPDRLHLKWRELVTDRLFFAALSWMCTFNHFIGNWDYPRRTSCNIAYDHAFSNSGCAVVLFHTTDQSGKNITHGGVFSAGDILVKHLRSFNFN